MSGWPAKAGRRCMWTTFCGISEKFLIDRPGNVIQRFSPDMTPDDPQLVAAIKGALAQ